MMSEAEYLALIEVLRRMALMFVGWCDKVRDNRRAK